MMTAFNPEEKVDNPNKKPQIASLFFFSNLLTYCTSTMLTIYTCMVYEYSITI